MKCMSTDKFLDQLTYYDTLSNLLPGLVFLWALSTLGPFPRDTITLLVTGNNIVDSILLVALSYVVGHVLQFLSKYLTETLIKKIFWKGRFFSEIFLIKAFEQCPEVELSRYISFIEKNLGFSNATLSVLLDPEVVTDKNKKIKAMELSGAIHRLIDARTKDSSVAQKAHLQNIFYSIFRNLSVLFLILGLADIGALILKSLVLNKVTLLAILLNFALSIIFMIRAKERGELYVKGLYWSYI